MRLWTEFFPYVWHCINKGYDYYIIIIDLISKHLEMGAWGFPEIKEWSSFVRTLSYYDVFNVIFLMQLCMCHF